MATQNRWRKALAISGLVHCLLLAGAGWLGGSLLKAAQVPAVIEVELISDPGRSEQKDAAAAAAPTTGPTAAVRTFVQPPASVDRSAVVAEMAADAVAEGFTPPAAGAAGNGGAAMAGPALPTAAGGAATPKRIAAPRLLAKTDPQYPEEARRAGAEGTVTVRIEIKENGQPGDIAVVRSSGRASFDAAAVEAVRSWRFVPAQETETGRAVSCYTTVAVVFRLRT
jgi:protein TonB